MKVKYLGHACFEFKAEKRILIDPFISQNPLCPLKLEEIEPPDLILVTHGHGDHIGDAIEIAKKANATIVAIHEIAIYAQLKGAIAEGMNIGGNIEIEGIKIYMTEAKHSSSIENICAGHSAGFIFELDGKQVYHAGDTGIFMDMKLIGELFDIYLALLPIGDRYTMGIKHAAIAAGMLKPKYIIPMHYNTFPIIRQNPEEFKKLAEKESDAKVIILKPGEELEI